MYPALFTTTLVFALAALRVRADFNVASVDLTQVSDSPKGSLLYVLGCLSRPVRIAVPACDPQLGQYQWSL